VILTVTIQVEFTPLTYPCIVQSFSKLQPCIVRGKAKSFPQNFFAKTPKPVSICVSNILHTGSGFSSHRDVSSSHRIFGKFTPTLAEVSNKNVLVILC
jgi:hypothetical protein